MKKLLKRFCLIMSLSVCIAGIALTTPVISSAKVKLNKKNLKLFVSQTFQLKLKGAKKKIKWNSNKKNIATVSNKGLVKAKKAGKATITAKSAEKKYICTVRVKINPDKQKNKNANLPETNTAVPQNTVPPQILQISESDIVLLKDETHTFSLTLNSAAVDNSGVEWSSSDAAVASVANGTISALKEGSAIISAKYNGMIVTCKVTVEKPYIEKNNITVQDPEVKDLLEKIATTTANLENDKKDLEKNQAYLESAQRALLKAQTTMIKVWDGTQWVYSTDKAAVTAAQTDVDYYTNIVEALKIKIPDEESLIASYQRQLIILIN